MKNLLIKIGRNIVQCLLNDFSLKLSWCSVVGLETNKYWSPLKNPWLDPCLFYMLHLTHVKPNKWQTLIN
jgi:hypothetical protein